VVADRAPGIGRAVIVIEALLRGLDLAGRLGPATRRNTTVRSA
jgi:hypothetical protein